MIDGKKIKIRTIQEASQTWLCLEGTILSYNQRIWADWGIVSIPIELITVVENKRFNGRRLIAAFLSILLGFVVGGLLCGILSLFLDSTVLDQYLGWLFGSCIVLGVVCFIACLIGFFIRQSTIMLRIAPGNDEIDFWVGRRNSSDLRLLIETIHRRRPLVMESLNEPINHPIGEIFVQPWKRTAGLVFLCSIPAMILEIEWMLLLGLIPIAFHVCSLFSNRKQPAGFRKSVKFYSKGDKNRALEIVTKSIGDRPDFLPARLLKIRLLIGLGNFQEAESVLEEVEDRLVAGTAEQIRKEIEEVRGVTLRKNWRESD